MRRKSLLPNTYCHIANSKLAYHQELYNKVRSLSVTLKPLTQIPHIELAWFFIELC